MRRRSNWTDPRLDDLSGRVTWVDSRIDSLWRTLTSIVGGLLVAAIGVAGAIVGLLANH